MTLASLTGWLPSTAQKIVSPFTGTPSEDSSLHKPAAESPQSPLPAKRPTHEFPSSRGRLSVREEGTLSFLGGSVSRACCVATGEEYDLRRLRVGAEEGGLVTLAALESLSREVELMSEVGPNLHVVRCHASIIENAGGTHCRLLLCDPCTDCLASYVLAAASNSDGAIARLKTDEATEIGQQLAFGIAHLHSRDLFCGSGLTSKGVLRGRDGFWKVADLSGCRRLPAWASDWQDSGLQSGGRSVPPEVSGAAEVETTVAIDIWMLGRLLAEVAIEGCASASTSNLLESRGADEAPCVPPQQLLQPLVARLWLLLHWLLTAKPSERPSAGEVAALLGKTLAYMTPGELLQDMPLVASDRVLATALAAARQLALESAASAALGGAARGALIDKLASAPLSTMREVLAETAAAEEFSQLCANCGIEGRLDEKPSECLPSQAACAVTRPSPAPADELSTDAGSSREAELEGDGDLLSNDGDSACGGRVGAVDNICGGGPANVAAPGPPLPDLLEFDGPPAPGPPLPDLLEFDGNPFDEKSPW